MMLREMLSEINEQDRFAKVRNRTKQTDSDFDALLNRSPTVVPSTHHAVSGVETHKHVRNIEPNAAMIKKMGAINPNLKDEISNQEASRRRGMGIDSRSHRASNSIDSEPVEPTTLPKIISRELATAGEVVPEWHMVKNLPAYLASAVRHIGRAVFKPFTRTPIEDIQVIANLLGKGPNTELEMNAVAGYLVKRGHRNRDAEIIFHDKIPDYGADIKVFKSRGVTYMMVKDFAGSYIYAWPSDHEYEKLAQESVMEAKKQKQITIKPPAKNLNQILITRKAGGHYTEKIDYKRSKERQKTRRHIRGDEEFI